MKKRVLTIWLALLATLPLSLQAQEGGYRFQPPPPPPLDGSDFDDSDEEVDMGDAGYRPQPIPSPNPDGQNGFPPPGMGMNGGLPPSSMGGGGNFGGLTTTPGKFRFKVVEGEFYEKGKKRTRGNQTRVSGAKAD